METKQKFGLFTSVCMIVGIVIGSGIFFKSDNVLIDTNGSILLGVIVFIIAAIAIIFGSLAMSELAMRTGQTGGIIAYAENHIGKRGGCVFGWFQNFVYYPTIISVVSWVTGIYGTMLFDIEASLELQIIIGIVTYSFLYGLNYLSGRASGYVQNAATIMKLVPIVVIVLAGFLIAGPDLTTAGPSRGNAPGWTAALGPIAFSYDGWIVATGISHEIKNSKRNLVLALIIAPFFILCAYLAYFIGISTLIGPDTIIALGDEHVDLAAQIILGPLGSKVFLIFVLISVAGTVNGLILGSSRGIYALGEKRMIPGSRIVAHIDEQRDTPTKATVVSFLITTVWMIIHYISTRFQLLNNSDVSEISIVSMYLLYIVLYLQVMKLKYKGEIKSTAKGYVIPLMAILGALIIFFGGMQNPMFWFYLAFNIFVLAAAYGYAGINKL